MILSHPPEYYDFDFLKCKVIGLNAKVAAGKTTFGQAFADYLNSIDFRARFFAEDIDNDYLDETFKDPKTHVFGFQKDALNRRMAIHREAQAFAAMGGIAIIDRDVFGDIAFANLHKKKGNISPQHYRIYEKEIERAKLFRPDLMIHLLCDSATAVDRAHKRGLLDKDAYDVPFMDDLEATTVAVLNEYYHGPLLDLEWSHNLSVSGDHDLSASGNTTVVITDEMMVDVLTRLKAVREQWLQQAKLAALIQKNKKD